MSILEHALTFDPKIKIPVVETVGIFPKGYVSIIAGEPASGKTWYMLDICRSVALGREGYNPGKVLLFAGETGFRMLLWRMRLLGGLGDNVDSVKIVSSHDMARLDINVMLNTAIGRRNIEGAIAEFKPDVVFFDTMISFVGDGKDESSQADMTDIIRGMSMIAGKYSTAVVLVHHFRKRIVRRAFVADDSDSQRSMDDVIGTSAFTRLASLVVGIERRKDVRLVHCIKSWWREFKAYSFSIRSIENGVEIRKDYGFSESVYNPVTNEGKALTEICETFGKRDKFTAIDVIAETSLASTTVYRAIKMGVAQKKICALYKNGRETYYKVDGGLE